MEYIANIQFIDLTVLNSIILFLVGFVGGMVSGFIGSGGAFVLTPAMMSMGVPAIAAVASNMAHKFPKALVGAYKRNKYGQVDIKLGVVMGLFAEVGVLFGKHMMVDIKEAFGAAGTNLYVSFVFIVVLAIVGTMVLRDGLQEKRNEGKAKTTAAKNELTALVKWVRQLYIPGTMMYFKSIDTKVSLLILAPLGFATGVLAATIAVGGFIGVPSMMYVLGLPAMTASATELVIAFVMGLGGSLLYALEGYVDIRLSMIILAGSLFGIQIGAIGTTYVKDYVVKFVMAAIMLLVLASRFFYIPGYLSELGLFISISKETRFILDSIGQTILFLALFYGAFMILKAIYQGMQEHKVVQARRIAEGAIPQFATTEQLSPLARFERFLVASDTSEFSTAAVREAINMAKCCNAELHIMSLVAIGMEYEAMGVNIIRQEIDTVKAHLDKIKEQAIAAGVTSCHTHLIQGKSIHQEIVALADEIRADLIIMGRRGRRGLARAMLGHATAMVIGQAHCNILVVPRASEIKGRQFLVATDGSRFAENAIITTTKLGAICKTPVTVVSVNNPSHSEERKSVAYEAVNHAAAHMHDKGVNVNTKTLVGIPAVAITELAKEINADLIITGSHGRTGLDRVLIGSTSERILNETPCAVLVVKTA